MEQGCNPNEQKRGTHHLSRASKGFIMEQRGSSEQKQQWVHHVYMDEAIKNDGKVHALPEVRAHGSSSARRPSPLSAAVPTKKGYDASKIFRTKKVNPNGETRKTKKQKNRRGAVDASFASTSQETSSRGAVDASFASASEETSRRGAVDASFASTSQETSYIKGFNLGEFFTSIAQHLSTCGLVACGLDDSKFGGMGLVHIADSFQGDDDEGTEMSPWSFSLEDSVTTNSYSTCYKGHKDSALVPRKLKAPRLAKQRKEKTRLAKQRKEKNKFNTEKQPEEEAVAAAEEEKLLQDFVQGRLDKKLVPHLSPEWVESSNGTSNSTLPDLPATRKEESPPSKVPEAPLEHRSESPPDNTMRTFTKNKVEFEDYKEQREVNVPPTTIMPSSNSKKKNIKNFESSWNNGRRRSKQESSSHHVNRNSKKIPSNGDYFIDEMVPEADNPAVIDLITVLKNVVEEIPLKKKKPSFNSNSSSRKTEKRRNGKSTTKKLSSRAEF